MTDAQLLLPFEVLEEEKTDWSWLPHIERPAGDNAVLLELQFQYRVNGQQKALAQIYELSAVICGKLINRETRRNRYIKRLSREEREEKARDAATSVITQYLKKKSWAIKKNFIGYLYLRVMHELYYRRKVDEIVDFVDLSTFYKEGTEDEEE